MRDIKEVKNKKGYIDGLYIPRMSITTQRNVNKQQWSCTINNNNGAVL